MRGNVCVLTFLPAAGLVLAAHLSSTVEPLTHVDTQPVPKVMDFLEQLIGNTANKPK